MMVAKMLRMMAPMVMLMLLMSLLILFEALFVFPAVIYPHFREQPEIGWES